jgi:uncharacterized protein (TIGR02118 family)
MRKRWLSAVVSPFPLIYPAATLYEMFSRPMRDLTMDVDDILDLRCITSRTTMGNRVAVEAVSLRRTNELTHGTGEAHVPSYRVNMIRLTVLYGHPDDPAEFDRYYREIHIPLARKMKGLKGWTAGKCQAADPQSSPAYYLIVGLYADDREQMESILQSAEGQETIADVSKFATGGVTFLYDDEEVLIPYSLP